MCIRDSQHPLFSNNMEIFSKLTKFEQNSIKISKFLKKMRTGRNWRNLNITGENTIGIVYYN